MALTRGLPDSPTEHCDPEANLHRPRVAATLRIRPTHPSIRRRRRAVRHPGRSQLLSPADHSRIHPTGYFLSPQRVFQLRCCVQPLPVHELKADDLRLAEIRRQQFVEVQLWICFYCINFCVFFLEE